MANYFVINNKFKPYSFDELIKPYQIYGQAYKEQEALLDAAKEKEFSPDYLDQTQDEDAYNMYTAANKGLQEVSDELATKGLSAGLRSRTRSAAANYKKTMDTLTTAQAQLNAERARRANLGSDYVFQQDDIRIGDFLNGKTPNQRGAKLSDIQKNIETEFSRRAAGISNTTWDKVLGKNGNVIRGYFDVTTTAGLTAAQLDSILNLDDKSWSELMSDEKIDSRERAELARFRNAINAEKSAIGYSKYSPENQSEIWGAIRRGATAGLAMSKHEYQRDLSYNPELVFRQKVYRDEQAAEEMFYTHSDENNPTSANRTGLKPGYYRDGNGHIRSESTRTTQNRTPYFGVKFYIKNGKRRDYGSEDEYNERGGWDTTDVTDISELSDKNKQRLAQALGFTESATDQEVWREAIRRGVSVGVIDHGFDERNGRQYPKSNQELKLVDHKTQLGVGASPSQGSPEQGFDPDA